jgi:hypothetical protein
MNNRVCVELKLREQLCNNQIIRRTLQALASVMNEAALHAGLCVLTANGGRCCTKAMAVGLAGHGSRTGSDSGD